jgi:methionyl-tRNA synthetase
MAKAPFFITTAIDYTNAAPHIGHAYEKILADVIARHFRQRGRDVFFLTGVDQHGQKVQQAAQREGLAPAEFANRTTDLFLSLWKTLGISYDGWAATTDERHKRVVQKILTDLHDRGELYKASHSGFYSVRQEQFLTDKERDENGSFGPEWGEVVELEEENWYFRLSGYKAWLEGFVDSHPEFVFPEFRGRELRNAIERLSGDLCISRPKSRLAWGIELPFDPEFVTYVWFDALINYISFAGFLAESEEDQLRFQELWPSALHVIGKDILVPAHGIYWPPMLRSLGFEDSRMPRLVVHGYVNLGGAKMSKSLGNVVNPVELAERYGADALRYYLMRDCVCGQDMDFSEERLISRFNGDLANGLGNLLNRTLNMTHRYRSGVLQKPTHPPQSALDLVTAIAATRSAVCLAFDAIQPHAALEAVTLLVNQANSFAENEAPWKLAKDPEQADRLDAVLSGMADVVWAAASLLLPFIPEKAAAILEQLQLPAQTLGGESEVLPSGHRVSAPVPVFPRIDGNADA